MVKKCLLRVLMAGRSDLAVTLVGKTSQPIFLFLTVMLVARALGPEAVATLAFLRLIPVYLILLFGMGVEFSNQYTIPRHPERFGQIVSYNLAVWLLVSIASAALFLPLAPVVRNAFFTTLGVAEVLAFPAVVSSFFGMRMISSIFQGRRRFWQASLVWLVYGTLLLGAQLILLLLGMGQASVMHSVLTASLAGFATGLILLLGQIRGARMMPDRRFWAYLLRFGFNGQMISALEVITLRLDHFILRFIAGPDVVGYYAIATKLAEAFRVIPDSVSFVMTPMLSRLTGAEARAKARRALGLVVPASVVFACLAFFCIPFLVKSVFGPQYARSIAASWILVAGVIGLLYLSPMNSYFIGTGRPRLVLCVSAVAGLVTIVADLVLIPLLGMNGAAAASSCAYLSGLVMASWLFARPGETRSTINESVLSGRRA